MNIQCIETWNRFSRISTLIVTALWLILSANHSSATQLNKYIVHKDTVFEDHTTFSAALASLGSAGGTVYLPAGNTLVSSTVLLNSKTSLVGQGKGVTFLRLTSPTGDVIRLNGDTASHISIEKMTITRGNTDSEYTTAQVTSGAGINLNFADFVRVSDCEIHTHYRCIETPQSSDDSKRSFDVRFDHCNIHRAKDAFMYLQDITEVHLTRSTLINSLNLGIYLFDMEGAFFSSCDLFGTKNHGVYVGGIASGECRNNLFDNFIIDTTGLPGLNLNLVVNMTYTSGWVASAGVTLNPIPTRFTDPWLWNYAVRTFNYIPGIDVQDGAKAIVISDNLILNNAGDGIWVHAPRDVTISNNVVHSNSKFSTSSAKAGIRVDGIGYTNISILGNRSYNEAVIGPPYQRYGLYLAGSGDYTIVTDNNFHDANHFASWVDFSVAPNKIINSNF